MNKIKFSSMEDDKELVIYGDCIESSNYLSKSLENPSTITGIGEKSKQITVKYNDNTITIPISSPMYGISLTNCNYSNDKLERKYTGIRLLSDEIRVTKDKVIYKKYINKMEITESTRMNNYSTNLHMGILVDSKIEPVIGDSGDFIKYCILSPQFKTGSGPNEVCLWALWSGDAQHIDIKSDQLTDKFSDNETRTTWIQEYNSTHSIPLTLYYGTHGPLETQDLTDTEYGQKLIALLPQLTSAPEANDGTNKVSIEMRRPGIIEATKFIEFNNAEE